MSHGEESVVEVQEQEWSTIRVMARMRPLLPRESNTKVACMRGPGGGGWGRGSCLVASAATCVDVHVVSQSCDCIIYELTRPSCCTFVTGSGRSTRRDGQCFVCVPGDAQRCFQVGAWSPGAWAMGGGAPLFVAAAFLYASYVVLTPHGVTDLGGHCLQNVPSAVSMRPASATVSTGHLIALVRRRMCTEIQSRSSMLLCVASIRPCLPVGCCSAGAVAVAAALLLRILV